MQTPQDIIREHAEEGARLRLEFFASQGPLLERIAFALAKSLAAGGKILVCGNGGSAADAQHMAAELVGRFLLERPSLPGIALTVDSSALTAIGNDYGFDEVFARQVRGLGRPGDALVGISTSGNSANVLAALQAAKEIGLATVGFSGRGGGRMAGFCDFLLDVPSKSTPLVQEIHGAGLHLICRLIDHFLFENAASLLDAGPQGV